MHVLAGEVRRQGCDVVMAYTGSLQRPDRMFHAPRRLRQVIDGCSLVHAQYGSGCGYVASKLRGPRLITLRGSDWYGFTPTTWKDRLHSLICRRLTRASLPAYQAVVVVSERMKSAVEPELDGQRVEVLPDGVDLVQFRPVGRLDARCRLGKPDDDSPWILFSTVSAANPLKREWLARAAVESLRKQMPDARLVVLTGKTHDEIPLWVNACDVVLLTSTHEGWPNIIKEALACNVPFVSTDVSDLRTIAQAEPSCHVAEPRPEDLARCLADTLRHGRPETLRRHMEPMRLTVIARRLLQLYEDILSVKTA